MSSLDKSSFVLGNELWEEHFESLLALVKAYIIDIWEERKSKLYGDVECAQQSRPRSPTGVLGKLLELMGRIVKGCVSEVSLAQVSCILMYVYVAPPTPVGAWSMALGLRQRFEYNYYYYWGSLGLWDKVESKNCVKSGTVGNYKNLNKTHLASEDLR